MDTLILSKLGTCVIFRAIFLEICNTHVDSLVSMA
jgi:hypothetical protein